MRAIILAAGEGSRLRPLTDRVPKPMLPVGGKPALEHNVRLLTSHGISEIIINTHYCAQAITQYFGDGSSFGAHITYSHEEQLLGTAGAVAAASAALTSPFVVLYGDNVSTCDLTALARQHSQHRAVLTLAVYHREGATAGGIVALDDDDRVLRFLEKPSAEQLFSSWVNAGIMICEREILDFIPAGVSDFGKDVLPALLAAQRPVYGYRMQEPREKLWWIDSPEDYRRTNRIFQS